MTAQPADLSTQQPETQLEDLADETLASPRPRAWARLVPLADPSAQYELVSEVVVVGRIREKGCHVTFSHPRISARHCEIRLREGEALLTDLSQNGTFVNAGKLAKESPTVIQSGDEVALLQPRSAPADLRRSSFYIFLRNDGGGGGARACSAGCAAPAAAADMRAPPAHFAPLVPPGVDVDALLAQRAPLPVALDGAHLPELRPPAVRAQPAQPRAAAAQLVPSMPSGAMDDLLKTYELHEVLGQGSFAVVRRGVHRQSGEHFAIKVITKRKLLGQRTTPSAEEKEKVLREAKILKRIKHDNVIKLYDVIETHDSLYLVMELVEGGELYDDLSKHGAFPEHQARELTAQLLSALGYLHAQGIVHRDLKPENILLAYEANTAPGPSQPRSVDCGVPLLKLADFGLAKMIHGGSAAKTFCGTPQYFAPEVLEARDTPRGYGTACDVWSAGVILYILLSGQSPFEGDDVLAQVRRGQYALPHDRWHAISASAKHLLAQMMTVDPQRRITVSAALRHPWMRGDELSPAELAQLEPSQPRGSTDPARALAVDDIEESWSDDGGQRTSSAHQPSRRSRAPRQPRSKAPTAALAMPGSQTLGTLPHQPPRAAGAGLMAPPKPPGANVRSALPAAEPTICAKRRRAAGGPSAAHRLPFAAGPPTLAHAKLPLVTEPGVPPFAARRLPLAPPHSAAIGSLGGDGHADMLLDPYCAHPPVAAAPGSTS